MAFETSQAQVIFPAGSGGGGGGTHGSGLLVDLPLAPVAGDSYAVTSGPGQGTVYYCAVDGVWSLMPGDTSQANVLASSTDWTLTPAAGSTPVIAGDTLTITTDVGSVNASFAIYAGAAIPSARWRLQFRWRYVNVAPQVGSFSRVFYSWDGSIPGVGYEAFRNQEDLGVNSFSAVTQATVIAGNVTLPDDFWFRAEIDGLTCFVWTGIGVGDVEPTSWDFRGQANNLVHIARPGPVSIWFTSGMEGGGAAVSSITFTVNNLTLRSLD